MATLFRAPVYTRIEKKVVQHGINAQNLLLTVLRAAIPFASLEWPNPRYRTKLLIKLWDIPQNLLGTTLAPVVAAAPFTPFYWPNPNILSFLIDIGWIQNLQTTTLIEGISGTRRQRQIKSLIKTKSCRRR